MSDEDKVEMDTPNGRISVPAATHRLRGADRSGLGEKGWAEVPNDRIGHPADTNVPEEYYEPASEIEQPEDRPL
jgi:hypothetical protein